MQSPAKPDSGPGFVIGVSNILDWNHFECAIATQALTTDCRLIVHRDVGTMTSNWTAQGSQQVTVCRVGRT
jgi:hypothetical protein